MGADGHFGFVGLDFSDPVQSMVNCGIKSVMSMGLQLAVVVLTVVVLLSAGEGHVFVSARGFKRPQLVPAVFAFGDSTTDAGTNAYRPHPVLGFLANYPPYGETYFHRATGRFSDGRLWIDFVTQKLGLPFLNPYLLPGSNCYAQGVNFASAGSGFDESVNRGKVVSFPEQFEQFLKVKDVLMTSEGKRATDFILHHALYVISSGSNDIFAFASNVTAPTAAITPASEAFLTNLLSEVQLSILNLHKEGARKIILRGLFPLGCLPPLRIATEDGSCNLGLNALAQAFNLRLAALAERLKTIVPNLLVIVVNEYHLLDQFINNGTSYGFTEGANVCCGAGVLHAEVRCGALDAAGNKMYTLCSNLHDYVFFDRFHPTERANGLLAAAFLDDLKKYPHPFGITHL